jgi:23S rRNA pseudouridine1911/1915/1917 synthase
MKKVHRALVVEGREAWSDLKVRDTYFKRDLNIKRLIFSLIGSLQSIPSAKFAQFKIPIEQIPESSYAVILSRSRLTQLMPHEAFVVSPQIPEPARRLLALIQSRLKLSKNESLQLIQAGGAKINGRICSKSHQMLEPGDRLEIDWIRQPVVHKPSATEKSTASFKVVHEDQDIVVVYKPANLLTVPTPHRESRTLLSMVTTHLKRNGHDDHAYCVHRLDRGVSGLLVFAKSLDVAELIRDQFAARKPERTYTAICAGRWSNAKGTIESYLTTDADLNRYSTDDQAAGELAITHFEVKQSWDDASLLEIRLETGRRNQIRVHMAEQGHPILGDPRYRPHRAEHWAWPYKRLALHAESLGLKHPRTGEMLKFKTSWPDEFRSFHKRMNKQST